MWLEKEAGSVRQTLAVHTYTYVPPSVVEPEPPGASFFGQSHLEWSWPEYARSALCWSDLKKQLQPIFHSLLSTSAIFTDRLRWGRVLENVRIFRWKITNGSTLS